MMAEIESTRLPLKKKDWALLVIYSAKPASLTPIQLQKSLFLLGQKLPAVVGSEFYHFVPHNFGPFAKEIYADVEQLSGEGLVEEISKPGQKWPEYMVSPKGIERAEALRIDLSNDALQYLDTLVKWVAGQSFQDLLQTVYRAYPDYAKNSVFSVGT